MRKVQYCILGNYIHFFCKTTTAQQTSPKRCQDITVTFAACYGHAHAPTANTQSEEQLGQNPVTAAHRAGLTNQIIVINR